jgi:hypothetical protein
MFHAPVNGGHIHRHPVDFRQMLHNGLPQVAPEAVGGQGLEQHGGRSLLLLEHTLAAAALGHMLLDNDALRLPEFAVNVRLQ